MIGRCWKCGCLGFAVMVATCLGGSVQSARAAMTFDKRTIDDVPHAYHIVADDFDGDGNPDLALTSWEDNQATVLLGSGDGTFPDRTVLGTRVHPNAIAVGDFNGDANPDLAITNGGGQEDVTLLFNGGNGMFWNASSLNVGRDADLNFVIAGKFTSDDRPDLAILKTSATDFCEIWEGDGNGGFSEKPSVDTGRKPIFAAAGDVDEDSHLDLVVANWDDNTVTILLGNGDGTFSQATGSPVSVGVNPRSVALGDLNGDGHLDIVTANYGDSTLSILLGQGDGTFTPGTPIVSAGNTAMVVVGDLDRDGKPDLSVTRWSADLVTVFRGIGDGTFSATSLDFEVGDEPGFLIISDLDRDGSLDLAVANHGSGDVTLLLNRSAACTAPPEGLVAWWKGEDNALDSIGSNDGTENEVLYADGKVGLAFDFNGTSAYLAVQDSGGLEVKEAMTVAAWIYPRSTSLAGIVRKLNQETNGSYGIYILDQKLHFQINGNALDLTSSSSIPANQWTHVAATYDRSAGEGKIYVNGILDQSGAYSESVATSLEVLLIGKFGMDPAAYFDGLMDELQLYGKALTAEEIAALVSAGDAGTCSPDREPEPFSFVDQQGVARGTEIVSNTLTVSGIDYETPIAVADCTSVACAYSINDGEWKNTSGTVKNGDSVRVRQTSSLNWSTTTDFTLIIGGVTDTFTVKTLDSGELTVEKPGTGNGTVTSEPGGIDCGADCEEVYASGTWITLTAAAAADSTFEKWSGCDEVLGNVCMVQVKGAATVEAHFLKKINGPDLMAQWTSVGSRLDGKLARAVLKISNIGNALAGPSRVSLYLSSDGVNPEIQIRTLAVPRLRPNSSRNWSIAYRSRTSSAGMHLIAVVDVLNQVLETDEENNAASCRIPQFNSTK